MDGPFGSVSNPADCGPRYGGGGGVCRRYVNRPWHQFITPVLNHVLRLVFVRVRAFVVLLCIILRVFKSFIINTFCV